MNLKQLVDKSLETERRTFDWLCTQLEMTPQGLRGALVNESLKFKDLKKLLDVLKIQWGALNETGNITQSVKGNYNNTGVSSSFADNPTQYKLELDHKNALIQSLEKQLQDKEQIIELLREKRG